MYEAGRMVAAATHAADGHHAAGWPAAQALPATQSHTMGWDTPRRAQHALLPKLVSLYLSVRGRHWMAPLLKRVPQLWA